MKKIRALVICFALIFGITAGTASAWDICIQDAEYITEYQISLDTGGMIIRGQAVADGQVIGPITGCVANGPAFAIQYLWDYGLRYYLLYGSQWYTWGIDSQNSGYYDGPRPAQIVPCGTTATEASSGATGANY